MTLGQKLRNARKTLGMTRVELAKKSGVALTTLASYEKDQVEPTLFKLTCIATVLHLSLDYLAACKIEEVDTALLRRAINRYNNYTTHYIPAFDQQYMDAIVDAAIVLYNSRAGDTLDRPLLIGP